MRTLAFMPLGEGLFGNAGDTQARGALPAPPLGWENCKAKPRSFPQKWLYLHTLQVKQTTNRHKTAKNLISMHDPDPDQNGPDFPYKGCIDCSTYRPRGSTGSKPSNLARRGGPCNHK